MALEEHRQEEDGAEEVSIIEPKGLTSKIISEVLCYVEAGVALLENHLDFERRSKVSASLERDYVCYTEIYREKKILSSSQPSTATSKRDQHHQHSLKVHLQHQHLPRALLLLLLQEVSPNLQQESI
jgi:hypothetical protein